MKKTRKYFIWFYMLSKRLLKKPSFIALLCLIPAIVPLVNIAMSQESGVLHIALCNEDSSVIASEIIETLTEKESVIRFSVCESKDEAFNDVRYGNIDAAWIFPGDFDDRINQYDINNPKEALIEVIEGEETTPLKLSHEVLFGSIYDNLSHSVYKSYVRSEIVDDDYPSDKIDEYYDEMDNPNSIIQLERLKSGKPTISNNYLTAPLRGILSLLIVLSALAATMYFLKDQSEKRFDWLPPKKRIAPAFASCLSASCLSAIAVFVALQLSVISVGIWNELISMALFVVATTGFCLVFSLTMKSYGKLGAIIPGLIIVMLILSPIFFNLKVLLPLRLMIPTHYYLYSIYNHNYYVYTIIYCIVVYSVCFVLNSALSSRRGTAV